MRICNFVVLPFQLTTSNAKIVLYAYKYQINLHDWQRQKIVNIQETFPILEIMMKSCWLADAMMKFHHDFLVEKNHHDFEIMTKSSWFLAYFGVPPRNKKFWKELDIGGLKSQNLLHSFQRVLVLLKVGGPSLWLIFEALKMWWSSSKFAGSAQATIRGV